ncbi:MAG: hypothetical protein MZV70_00250 [Desulfobacterales bacterium]|nr:hypothetical protein [Desulfobacterales bacterium]
MVHVGPPLGRSGTMGRGLRRARDLRRRRVELDPLGRAVARGEQLHPGGDGGARAPALVPRHPRGPIRRGQSGARGTRRSAGPERVRVLGGQHVDRCRGAGGDGGARAGGRAVGAVEPVRREVADDVPQRDRRGRIEVREAGELTGTVERAAGAGVELRLSGPVRRVPLAAAGRGLRPGGLLRDVAVGSVQHLPDEGDVRAHRAAGAVRVC